jgi:hypothetical protein
MGLFGRKKTEIEETESPSTPPIIVGKPSSPPALGRPSGPPQKVLPPPPLVHSEPPREVSMSEVEEATSMKPLPPPAPAAVATPAFTIDDMISLMRQLPSRSLELVMQVVKKTLESVGVELATIIEAAREREENLELRIGDLKLDIDRLEGEIATRKREITKLEGEQKEVAQVKERLSLALRLEGASEAMADRPLVKPNLPPPPPPIGNSSIPSPSSFYGASPGGNGNGGGTDGK